jgi:hypothetical protein
MTTLPFSNATEPKIVVFVRRKNLIFCDKRIFDSLVWSVVNFIHHYEWSSASEHPLRWDAQVNNDKYDNTIYNE